MRRVDKPWGFESRLFMDDRQDLWLMSFKAGHRSSLHRHPNKDKWLFVVEGSATLVCDGTYVTATRGDRQFVPKNVPHRQIAHTDCKILELEWPPCKTDIVRMEDAYGRESAGYEDPDANCL